MDRSCITKLVWTVLDTWATVFRIVKAVIVPIVNSVISSNLSWASGLLFSKWMNGVGN